ncbi:MAG: hypothetical protein QF682_07220 [Candidatus Thermoplasmatota archaeon]|nr:hypothetical protein [Candidatus Thermoplasmatota archaeon]
MTKGTKIGISMMLIFMLICVLVPSIAYASEEGSVTETFSSTSEVTAVATIKLSGEDASDFRYGINYFSGSNDTEVTSSEVDEFEDEMEEDLAAKESDYTLDGNRGTYTNIIVSITGAAGWVKSTDEITIEGQTKITFSSINNEADSHSYKVFMEEDETGSDYELTVPSGYKIDTIKGLSNPVKSNGDKTVKGITTEDNIEINDVERHIT